MLLESFIRARSQVPAAACHGDAPADRALFASRLSAPGLYLLCGRVYFALQSGGQKMRDLNKALADIFAIRSQIAAGTAFRGYGPAAVAATGGLALVTGSLQFLWLDSPSGHPLEFFSCWAAAALVSAGIIWSEMQARSRRHHS